MCREYLGNGTSLIRRIDLDQRYLRGVDQHLAGVLEVYGHAVADGGLNLAQAPVGFGGMADVHAGEKMLGHGGFRGVDLRACLSAGPYPAIPGTLRGGASRAPRKFL